MKPAPALSSTRSCARHSSRGSVTDHQPQVDLSNACLEAIGQSRRLPRSPDEEARHLRAVIDSPWQRSPWTPRRVPRPPNTGPRIDDVTRNDSYRTTHTAKCDEDSCLDSHGELRPNDTTSNRGSQLRRRLDCGVRLVRHTTAVTDSAVSIALIAQWSQTIPSPMHRLWSPNLKLGALFGRNTQLSWPDWLDRADPDGSMVPQSRASDIQRGQKYTTSAATSFTCSRASTRTHSARSLARVAGSPTTISEKFLRPASARADRVSLEGYDVDRMPLRPSQELRSLPASPCRDPPATILVRSFFLVRDDAR